MAMEKRKYKRYVFPNDDRIIALLALDNGGTADARILNISQGGIGLAVEKKKMDGVKTEAVLLIKDVSGERRIPGLAGHSLKVKWVLDYQPLDNVAIGCEFIELSEQCRTEIAELLVF